MNRKSITATVAAVAMGAGLAVLGTVAPASALAGCEKFACVWADEGFATNGYSSASLSWNRYIPDMTQWSFYGTTRNANDEADSGVNRGSWDPIRLFKDVNHAGNYRRILPQSSDSNFSNSAGITDWHDTTSSVYFVSELS